MSIDLVFALLTGALCLGMASALPPFTRGGPEAPERLYEDEVPDRGGPVIDLSPMRRGPAERIA